MDQAASALVTCIQHPCTRDELHTLARAVLSQTRSIVHTHPPHITTTVHFARCILAIPFENATMTTASSPPQPQQYIHFKKAHAVIRLVTDFFAHLTGILDEMASAKSNTFTRPCTDQIRLHMSLFHQATTATLHHVCTPACEKQHAPAITHLTTIQLFAAFLLANIY